MKSALKNITFSADEKLIADARARATAQNRTLNEAFREWLAQFAENVSTAAVDHQNDVAEFEHLLRRLSHVDSHGPYTRDEMNER